MLQLKKSLKRRLHGFEGISSEKKKLVFNYQEKLDFMQENDIDVGMDQRDTPSSISVLVSSNLMSIEAPGQGGKKILSDDVGEYEEQKSISDFKMSSDVHIERSEQQNKML